MELNDLIGLRNLSGVDFSVQSIQQYGYYFQDCQCINFILDDVTYTAVENPDDGYRSSLDEIKVSDFKMTNQFKPVKVLGMIRDESILDLVDVVNGKIALSVGTDGSDNYYPSFVSDWRPENLHINETLSE